MLLYLFSVLCLSVIFYSSFLQVSCSSPYLYSVLIISFLIIMPIYLIYQSSVSNLPSLSTFHSVAIPLILSLLYL